MSQAIKAQRICAALLMASLSLAVGAGEASAHSSADSIWQAPRAPDGPIGQPFTSRFVRPLPTVHEGVWSRGSGGGTRLRAGFLYTRSEQGETARWHLGDVQGEFRLWVHVPEDTAEPLPTAKVIYTVWEKRVDEAHYCRVRPYRLDQAARRGWKSFRTTAMLDGDVMIQVERQADGSGVMAASGAGLARVDLLPEQRPIARRACQRDAAVAAVASAKAVIGDYPSWRALRVLLDHGVLAAVGTAERFGADALRPAARGHVVAEAQKVSLPPSLPSASSGARRPGPRMPVDEAVRWLLAGYDWAETQAKAPAPSWAPDSAYDSYLAQCRHYGPSERDWRNPFHAYGDFADALAWASQQRRLGSGR